MIRFEDIQERVESYHPDADFDLLRRAYVFSAMEHRNQLRKSGEPYLVHPLEVAYILADLKLDVTTVAVGLLHDVLEDTLTTREVLVEYFDEEIADLVEGLSKISRFEFRSAEEREAENFRKMMLAMVDDLRVVLVKLADRLHNMRTLEHLDPDRRERIARETMEIYAPIANRLGLGGIKGELEDLSFRFMEPASYETLTRRLRERRSYNDTIIRTVRGRLQVELDRARIPAEITGRVKRICSIARKMRKQGIDIGEVYDYVAFRVLTDDVKNCYGVLGIIHGLWRPVPGRIKDYIAMPKPNRYQSLHTSVVGEQGHPFEIQVRTREMDEIAEKGIAAHWKYKEGKPLLPEEVRNLEWVQQMVDLQTEVEDPREFLHAVKLDLYREEVYAFTPKGQLKSLPRGATPIDFAYQVHTEVGNHCSGARVNGRLVPLRTQLQTGDVVEILTSPQAHPSRDWLKLVRTPSARSKIRQWLGKQEHEQAAQLGRTLLERELRRYRLPWKAFQDHPELAELSSRLGSRDTDELVRAVGYGRVLPQELLERLFPDRARKDSAPAGSLGQAVKRILGVRESRVVVAGMADGMVTLAKCCSPVSGDPIVGYVTRGRGVTVHHQACPNAERLMFDPERRIEVAWAPRRGASYAVRVLVHSEDRRGMLARVTSAIAAEQANIKDVQAETTEDSRGRISLTLTIEDRRQLERILARLRALEGVSGVERVLG